MAKRLNIGCHLSNSKGFLNMGKEALSIGANTFQFFTRNPRGGQAKDISQEDVDAYLKFAEENKFTKIVAHAPYTLNLSAADEKIRDFARRTMKDDLMRMEYVPGNYYNFHPGNHVGQGTEKGIELIAEILNEIITKEQSTMVLLETMAGKGTEIGKTFSEIKAIYDKVNLKEKIGVCMDTCHIFDGGYDIVNNLDDVLLEFDNIIGLEHLKAVHLNDSKHGYESHKDRHEKIGDGFIGIESMKKIINHPSLKDLPFLLETPNELDGYANEIKILKEVYEND